MTEYFTEWERIINSVMEFFHLLKIASLASAVLVIGALWMIALALILIAANIKRLENEKKAVPAGGRGRANFSYSFIVMGITRPQAEYLLDVIDETVNEMRGNQVGGGFTRLEGGGDERT